jgi:hypothetical protein
MCVDMLMQEEERWRGMKDLVRFSRSFDMVRDWLGVLG